MMCKCANNESKIKGYKIVLCPKHDYDLLSNCINEYIKEGWEPFGSPFIDGPFVYQPVVIRL